MTDTRLVVIGGANGAGKSTLAAVYSPELIAAERFLNADDIARRLSPANQVGVVRRTKSFARKRAKFAWPHRKK